MSTIINNPNSTDESSGNMATVLFVIIAILIFGYLFFVFALPSLRPTNINVQMPDVTPNPTQNQPSSTPMKEPSSVPTQTIQIILPTTPVMQTLVPQPTNY